ncbi:hypothetical protein L228DRAFT_261763 [Xylona heveae TC161]|uniref:Uncharacterized protein n=1 Tax=Xylona heveae (strain CBS 132557 / TC161) TaxID=1328760 RepID=A0A165G0V8_XYLHT|nr:hypothetical protein L228DRAFT_261763 [Xylona heveae TC161]KZF21609.1 hypothetical protein L228DRAFT_261763 [Xylona heveae TC161]
MSYLEKRGVTAIIDDITPTSLESKTRSFWITMLPAYFPDTDYSIEAEPYLENKTGVANGDLLFIESKRANVDKPSVWEETERGQLLNHVKANRNANDCAYGAIAIGRKVKFYFYNGKELLFLYGPYSIEVRSDAEAIVKVFDEIKTHPRTGYTN